MTTAIATTTFSTIPSMLRYFEAIFVYHGRGPTRGELKVWVNSEGMLARPRIIQQVYMQSDDGQPSARTRAPSERRIQTDCLVYRGCPLLYTDNSMVCMVNCSVDVRCYSITIIASLYTVRRSNHGVSDPSRKRPHFRTFPAIAVAPLCLWLID